MHRESVANIIFVTVAVCLVCSVVVSTAAVGLRPLYDANQKRHLQASVLEVAGIDTEDKDVAELFRKIDVRILDLESGGFVAMDAAEFDKQKLRSLSNKEDIAKISVRPNYVKVYLLRKNNVLNKVILPIHGYGLWSVLYGFISLEVDGNTVYDIRFYKHAETPGLGGEVDNPVWQALWRGKRLYNDQGQAQLAVIKGRAQSESEDYPYQIDGLSGATLTSYGVTQMIRFWAGELGYRTFLRQLAAGAIS